MGTWKKAKRAWPVGRIPLPPVEDPSQLRAQVLELVGKKAQVQWAGKKSPTFRVVGLEFAPPVLLVEYLGGGEPPTFSAKKASWDDLSLLVVP